MFDRFRRKMPKTDPNFTIELAARAGGVFFYMPGEVVDGNVCRTVTEAQEIVNGLQLDWVGRAYAAWLTQSQMDPKRMISHSNEEIYFNLNHPLSFSTSNGESTVATTLPRGHHRIPFWFQLPSGIPSTYKAFAEDKEIKYSVTATLKRQGSGASVLTATIQIHVWRPTDLNDFPQFLGPNILTKSKTIGCCCCKSGPVGFTLRFPRMAYLVGETIDCTVELFNGSSTDIRKIEAKLVETVEVKGRDGSTTYGGPLLTCLKKIDLPGIAPGASETFQISMDLMPVNYHPLDLNGCSFMRAIRKILVEMTIPGCAGNLIGSTPIAIGVIPYRTFPPLEVALQQPQSTDGQQSTGQQSPQISI